MTSSTGVNTFEMEQPMCLVSLPVMTIRQESDKRKVEVIREICHGVLKTNRGVMYFELNSRCLVSLPVMIDCPTVQVRVKSMRSHHFDLYQSHIDL